MVYKISDIKHLELMSSLQKTNPKKIDFDFIEKTSKENSLDANILKLCSALKENGFHRYSEDLENKFVALKQAQANTYNTIKETGEDVVEFAHPKGDVKIEDAKDKHGEIETIISQEKKDIDIVNKKPTGKLACDLIVRQCLIAVGQNIPESIQKKSINYLEQASELLRSRVPFVPPDLIIKDLKYKKIGTRIDNILLKILSKISSTQKQLLSLSQPKQQEFISELLSFFVDNKTKIEEFFNEEESSIFQKYYSDALNVIRKSETLVMASKEILQSMSLEKSEQIASAVELKPFIDNSNSLAISLKNISYIIDKNKDKIKDQKSKDFVINSAKSISEELIDIVSYFNAKDSKSFKEVYDKKLSKTKYFKEPKSFEEYFRYLNETRQEFQDYLEKNLNITEKF